jgi:hypothetical protein
MEKSPSLYISNKAMLLAAIAALISLGSLILTFLPSEKPPHTEIVSASPSPSLTTSPTPRPTRKPKPEPTASPKLEPTPKTTQRPGPTSQPTPDYPYRNIPMLDYPADGAVFSAYPRRLILHWIRDPISDAVRYKVTITHGSVLQAGWFLWKEVETPGQQYVEEAFPCACPGRWRVTAIFADGRLGMPTEWRTFRFTQ